AAFFGRRGADVAASERALTAASSREVAVLSGAGRGLGASSTPGSASAGAFARLSGAGLTTGGMIGSGAALDALGSRLPNTLARPLGEAGPSDTLGREVSLPITTADRATSSAAASARRFRRVRGRGGVALPPHAEAVSVRSSGLRSGRTVLGGANAGLAAAAAPLDGALSAASASAAGGRGRSEPPATAAASGAGAGAEGSTGEGCASVASRDVSSGSGAAGGRLVIR